MAMRGTPARRSVGDPLGGVLRDLDRRARSTSRRAPGPPGECGPEGPAGPPGPPGASPAVVVMTTDDEGRCRWTFPEPFDGAPVVSALPAGTGPLLVVLESVTAADAVLRVWSGSVGAGPGVLVHAAAMPAPNLD